jgi:hypothetical protein
VHRVSGTHSLQLPRWRPHRWRHPQTVQAALHRLGPQLGLRDLPRQPRRLPRIDLSHRPTRRHLRRRPRRRLRPLPGRPQRLDLTPAGLTNGTTKDIEPFPVAALGARRRHAESMEMIGLSAGLGSRGGPPKDRLSPRSCVPDPVSYTAALPIGESAVAVLSGLPAGEQVQRGTRTGRRALGCYRHAVLVLRWFLDSARVAQLAVVGAGGHVFEPAPGGPPHRARLPVCWPRSARASQHRHSLLSSGWWSV